MTAADPARRSSGFLPEDVACLRQHFRQVRVIGRLRGKPLLRYHDYRNFRNHHRLHINGYGIRQETTPQTKHTSYRNSTFFHRTALRQRTERVVALFRIRRHQTDTVSCGNRCGYRTLKRRPRIVSVGAPTERYACRICKRPHGISAIPDKSPCFRTDIVLYASGNRRSARIDNLQDRKYHGRTHPRPQCGNGNIRKGILKYRQNDRNGMFRAGNTLRTDHESPASRFRYTHLLVPTHRSRIRRYVRYRNVKYSVRHNACFRQGFRPQ